MARCEAPDPTIVRDKIGQSPDTPVGTRAYHPPVQPAAVAVDAQ